jgi:hypothetical protein
MLNAHGIADIGHSWAACSSTTVGTCSRWSSRRLFPALAVDDHSSIFKRTLCPSNASWPTLEVDRAACLSRRRARCLSWELQKRFPARRTVAVLQVDPKRKR